MNIQMIPSQMTTIAYGALDKQVRLAQWALRIAGFYRGALDGYWFGVSDTALRLFQENRGLKVDGEVGSIQTWPAFKSVIDAHLKSGGSVPSEILAIREITVVETNAPSRNLGEMRIAVVDFGHVSSYSLRKFCDASNKFSDLALGHFYRPTRADIFAPGAYDPDTHKAHLMLDQAGFDEWNVQGASAFHTEWIAPGDDDLDAVMVTNVSLPGWTKSAQHEHNEGSGNPGVDKVFVNYDKLKVGENSDWVQGAPCEVDGVELEHFVTEDYLNDTWGENPAKYDSAHALGQPPIVTNPGQIYGWGMYWDHANKTIERVWRNMAGPASSSVLVDVPAHYEQRLRRMVGAL